MTESSWATLCEQAPDVVSFGKSRIDGKVAYLSTVRSTGFPRTHPVTPIVGESGCYLFAEPGSSKVRDFELNKGFSLHCGMSDSSGSSGEFQMTGTVKLVTSEETRKAAEAICSYRPAASYLLYELHIHEAVATAYRSGRPQRTRWVMDDATAHAGS